MQNHNKDASRAAERKVNPRAPTFAATLRPLRSEDAESRVSISVTVKPASCNATARKAARLPAPTMATAGFVIFDFRLTGAAYLNIVDMAKSAGTQSGKTKPAQARVLSSRLSYQGPVFSVTTDEVEEPGGVRARRDVIRHSGSIVVLAVEEPVRGAKGAEPLILLERQY